MKTQNAIHHPYLLLVLLLLAACDDPVSTQLHRTPLPVTKALTGESVAAPSFSGPSIVVFTAGASQTVEYLAEQEDQEQIDITVSDLPEGAGYTVADDGGSYRKLISISWTPDREDVGLHVIHLSGRTKAGGHESSVAYDFYVNQQ